MRCKSCDYPLWSIPARQCPECGEGFVPDEFEFVPNSVRFCCPHCDQTYYGTGPRGELVPDAFDCVNCGSPVTMNTCVLRPAAGVDEGETRMHALPWLERRERGRFKSWMSMLGMALVRPSDLMRGLPVESSVWQAWWFAIVTQLLIMIVSMVPMFAVMLFPALIVPQGQGGPSGLALTGIFAGVVVGGTLASLVATLIMVVLWGLLAHGFLRISGETTAGLGRTFQALLYSSGANIVTAVPCFGQYFGWIWWVVSAVLAVRTGQGTGGWRASIAVVLFPVLLTIGVVVLYGILILSLLNTAGTATAAQRARFATAVQSAETMVMTQSIKSYARAHDGAAPAHALDLVASDEIGPGGFVSADSGTTYADVVFGPHDLSDLLGMGPRKIEGLAAIEAERIGDAPMYRFGDFLFTGRGIDISDLEFDPDAASLWLVLLDPVDGMEFVHAGCVDGSIDEIQAIDFDVALEEQNLLRADHGLPDLVIER